MTKTLLLSSLLVSLLLSRENPFLSTSENKTHSTTAQDESYKPPLTTMTYNFPAHSRVLKEVTFSFQNLDGSTETRKLEIDQSIDWRIPLVLSQHGQPIKQAKSPASSTSGSLDFIRFSSTKNHLSIVTKDPMIRTFSLSDPNSIIIDFKHDGIFEMNDKELHTAPFTNVKVTNHGEFARTTIALDGSHICKVSKTPHGAMVTCK